LDKRREEVRSRQYKPPALATETATQEEVQATVQHVQHTQHEVSHQEGNAKEEKEISVVVVSLKTTSRMTNQDGI